MPFKPKQYCKHPGCNQLVEQKIGYCEQHKKPISEYENNRESSSKRGYNSRWQRARARYLREHPLCEECLRNGIITPATVVDHKKPHRGNYELFWDESNWESSCETHHNIKTGKGQ